ncbi:hypothetical protein H9P43_000120 [Blastocladiella emersonii ATCC 22665]|nr:hypothetical protein H9P43_000120 [Blastocladiella emersonii ATCC 22665]
MDPLSSSTRNTAQHGLAIPLSPLVHRHLSAKHRAALARARLERLEKTPPSSSSALAQVRRAHEDVGMWADAAAETRDLLAPPSATPAPTARSWRDIPGTVADQARALAALETYTWSASGLAQSLAKLRPVLDRPAEPLLALAATATVPGHALASWRVWVAAQLRQVAAATGSARADTQATRGWMHALRGALETLPDDAPPVPTTLLAELTAALARFEEEHRDLPRIKPAPPAGPPRTLAWPAYADLAALAVVGRDYVLGFDAARVAELSAPGMQRFADLAPAVEAWAPLVRTLAESQEADAGAPPVGWPADRPTDAGRAPLASFMWLSKPVLVVAHRLLVHPLPAAALPAV